MSTLTDKSECKTACFNRESRYLFERILLRNENLYRVLRMFVCLVIYLVDMS